MPSITVSAVSTGSDTLTATGHGLVTGDRFRLRNINGALPAATPSLAAVTDYFAVRVDNNTLKIATSSADALAGTPVVVDLTGTGSGTTFVEHSLPYCIPTALAAAGTQIKSANDNGAWNALVAIYDLLTAQAQSIWTSVLLGVDLVMGANKNITLSGTGEYKHAGETVTFAGFVAQSGTVTFTTAGDIVSASSCVLIATIPLNQGDRITSITVTFDSSTGTVDVTDFHVDKITANGTATSLGSTTVSNIGTVQTTTIDLTDTTLAANERFIVSIAINATGCTVRNANATYTHP